MAAEQNVAKPSGFVEKNSVQHGVDIVVSRAVVDLRRDFNGMFIESCSSRASFINVTI